MGSVRRLLTGFAVAVVDGPKANGETDAVVVVAVGPNENA